METYSHAFFTWALAKHGVKTGRAAGIAGAVGATLPDVPSIAGTAYYIGMPFLREGWSSMDSEAIRDPIYVSGPFGATGVALHSAVPPLALLLLYVFLNLGSRDHRKILLWFLLGWLGHAVADFFSHVDGARPLFWPLSDWEWSSPVSYYDPLYYGNEFFAISHALILLTMAALLVRRMRRQDKGPKTTSSKNP
ncbi:MAG: hypothetical protein M3338_02890 [Actinomycetota bacterium]|nr:hypothetical protein [Actinomycetota bacterium]